VRDHILKFVGQDDSKSSHILGAGAEFAMTSDNAPNAELGVLLALCALFMAGLNDLVFRRCSHLL
jgi:hypothetical protein